MLIIPRTQNVYIHFFFHRVGLGTESWSPTQKPTHHPSKRGNEQPSQRQAPESASQLGRGAGTTNPALNPTARSFPEGGEWDHRGPAREGVANLVRHLSQRRSNQEAKGATPPRLDPRESPVIRKAGLHVPDPDSGPELISPDQTPLPEHRPLSYQIRGQKDRNYNHFGQQP